MIVCQCLGTNEAAIRQLAALGASSVGEVGMACGAGTDCGSCLATIGAVLDQCRAAAHGPMHHAVHSIAFDPLVIGAGHSSAHVGAPVQLAGSLPGASAL